MRVPVNCFWLTLTAVALLAGCENAAPPADNTDSGVTTSDSGVKAQDWAAGALDEPKKPAFPARPEPQGVYLRPVYKKGYEQVLAEHRGKVVLVDVWATWCQPCLDEFPRIVEWQKKLGPQGFAVIALCIDDDVNLHSAKRFLERQGGEQVNLRSIYGSDKDGVRVFDIENRALPHYKLYGRDGKLVKKYNSGDGYMPDLAEVEKDIAALLEEKEPTKQE